ncbi:MAG: hypothetical protein EOP00_36235, partial [Pedobacter sp.]
MDTIYSKLYKIPNKLAFDNDSEYYYSRKNKVDSLYVDFANKNQAYKTFISILPNKKDYFEYSTEISIPSLETGTYLMMVTTKKDSLSETLPYGYAILNASELTISSSSLANSERFQILHRKTGKPIENAEITLNGISLKTNATGYAINPIKENDRFGYRTIQAVYENDTITEKIYSPYYNKEDKSHKKPKAKVNLFTDRAIYRPGQSVFFKGILVQTKNEKLSVVPNIFINVFVENTNGEEIYSARLKTNEFGSVAGEFTIPKNSLTGDFQIIAEEDEDYKTDEHYNKTTETHPFWDEIDKLENSQARFQVEEYKRPKFEISFELIKDNFIA